MKSFYQTAMYYPFLRGYEVNLFTVGKKVRHRVTKRVYTISSQFYGFTCGWMLRFEGYGNAEWPAKDYENIAEGFTLDVATD